MPKESILVTGGTGSAGKYIVDTLLHEGHDVRVLSTRRNPSSRVPTVVGDITNEKSLYNAFDGVSTLVHAAGATNLADTLTLRKVNELGTRHVFQAARKAGVDRAIVLSSTSVYGIQEKRFESGEEPVTEENPTSPRLVYGKSKLTAERITREYRGIDTTILRPANIIGANIETWTQMLLRRLQEQKWAYPLTTTSFNYIDAESLALIVRDSITNFDTVGQTINAVDGTTTMAHLMNEYGKLLGVPAHPSPLPPFVYTLRTSTLSLVEMVTSRQVELRDKLMFLTTQRRYSHEKARQLLPHWKPKPLDASIAETRAWGKDHGYYLDAKK
jgi:nucleoside-diphosphate-sugar epimerase